MIDAREIAKSIYDSTVKEGLSTDYCYSPNFYYTAKKIAKQRAESMYNYKGDELKEICKEIDKL